MPLIKVVAVDDHPAILDSIRRNIQSNPDMKLVAEGTTGADVLDLVRLHQPDVLLLDLAMPQTHDVNSRNRFKPIPTIETLRREFTGLRILVLSMRMEPVTIFNCIEAGVAGYISKSDLDFNIGHAIRAVADGSLYISRSANAALNRLSTTVLTRRQVEVLTAISHAPQAAYGDLAEELGVTESTFKKHLTYALERLDASGNKLAAIKKAEELGLL